MSKGGNGNGSGAGGQGGGSGRGGFFPPDAFLQLILRKSMFNGTMSAFNPQELADTTITRVIVHYGDVQMVGTGFYIDANTILTAAHVLLGNTHGRKLVDNEPEDSWEGLLRNRLKNAEIKVMLSSESITIKEVELISGAEDLAIIRTATEGVPIQWAENSLELGQEMFILGYPTTIQILDEHAPYAYLNGHVTSRGKFCIGGYATRPLIQVFCPCFGGLSGAPVFNMDKKVAGMLSGQVRWGDDHFLFNDPQKDGSMHTVTDAFHVPLPYGFVTEATNLKRWIE